MATMAAAIGISEERAAFVEAIRDFAARECGTREQRARLTNDWEDPTTTRSTRSSPSSAGSAAACPRSTAGRAAARTTPACCSRRPAAGQVPIHCASGLADRGQGGREVRDRGAEARLRRRGVPGRGRVDRDVRARLGLGCRRAQAAAPSASRAATSSTARRPGSRAPTHAARILLVCRTDNVGIQARGDHDARRAGGHARGWRSARSTRWAAATSTTSTSPTRSFPRSGWSAARARPGRQLMAGPELRARGDRRDDPRHRPARVRRRARVRQGARAVRPAGRVLPDDQAPHRRPRDRARVLPAAASTTSPAAPTSSPTGMLPREASMAKLKITETAKHVALEGMQMMGGYGYSTEYDMERHLRTVVVSTVYARHQRNPARDHRQDLWALSARVRSASCGCWNLRASGRARSPRMLLSDMGAEVVRLERPTRGTLPDGTGTSCTADATT